MEDIANKDSAKIYKAEMLFKTIEAVTGLKKKDILAKNRNKYVAMTRNILGYILYREIGLTSTDTAKIIERNHKLSHYNL